MGKVQQYTQKFRKEWLKQDNFANWLLECPVNTTRAFCKYCRCEINAKLSDLTHHMKTKKHIKTATPFSSARSQQLTLNISSKILKHSAAEAKLAMFVCNHSSILSIDHLSLLCKNVFNESLAASQLRLHQTKCIELNSCNAESLAFAVKETSNIYKLPLENLIGIATDNCSTMIGINNGLYQKLKMFQI